MLNKKKILIIYPKLFPYRIPIFNLLVEKYDLTVLHSGMEIKENVDNSIKQIIVPIKHFGPFSSFMLNLHKICKRYDVVISEGSTRYLDRNLLIVNRFRSYKWINWGIGVSASYNKKFDQNKKFDSVRHFLYKMSDASIFYSDYPVPKYLSVGFDESTLFVANNTTAVSYNENIEYKKDSILFIGTLYKAKRIYDLLHAYNDAFKKIGKSIPLNIIGDGDEYSNITKWINNNGLTDNINLVGPIFDQEKVEPYFRKAFACISPGQAGLSVLTSMGHGTPFVTKRSAITGGEIFNIDSGKTGVLYDNSEELKDIVCDISNNPPKYVQMGKEARNYYLEHRRPDQMAKAIINAIEFVGRNA
jgi:glycosyltransferase involved in cell wall biosynthesis